MKTLKKFFVVTSLSIMLAGTALADCPLPLPGETNAPPCNAAQELTNDNSSPITTPATISNEVEIVFWDAVIAGLENLLTVF